MLDKLAASRSTIVGASIILHIMCWYLLVMLSVTCRCRFMSTDEQLYKDLEGVLEQSCDMFRWRHQQSKQPITQTDQLTSLLEFWDGICHLYTSKAKASHWVGHLLKTLKLFTAEARKDAASAAEISSAVMTNANPLWAELKAPRIKALFETADVADANGNSSKRQKRSGTHRLDG